MLQQEIGPRWHPGRLQSQRMQLHHDNDAEI